jgi:hypothetical protein
LSIVIPSFIKADVISDSSSSHKIYVNGVEVGTITMKSGIITIQTKAKAADNDIRYKTVGFSVTRNRVIAQKTFTKKFGNDVVTFDGIDSLSTVGWTTQNVLWLKNAEVKNGEVMDGYVTTTFVFNATQVSKALQGETFQNITSKHPSFFMASLILMMRTVPVRKIFITGMISLLRNPGPMNRYVKALSSTITCRLTTNRRKKNIQTPLCIIPLPKQALPYMIWSLWKRNMRKTMYPGQISLR